MQGSRVGAMSCQMNFVYELDGNSIDLLEVAKAPAHLREGMVNQFAEKCGMPATVDKANVKQVMAIRQMRYLFNRAATFNRAMRKAERHA